MHAKVVNILPTNYKLSTGKHENNRVTADGSTKKLDRTGKEERHGLHLGIF